MVTLSGVVLDTVVETADTRTIVLDVGSSPVYRAGQYATVDPHQFPALRSFVGYLEHLKGRREAPRAYSLSSAPNEPHLAITIKEETYEPGAMKYPPLLSGFLVHQIHAGERLLVRGFAGQYTLPDDVESRAGHVLHLCAGSGSVPNFSILKDSLDRHARLRHTFVYSNRTAADIIFRDALERLSAEHPERLRVIHTLTRETATGADGGVRRGRVELEWLRVTLASEPDSLVYVCGPTVTVWERRAAVAQGTRPPPRFMETMRSHLDALGIPRERIKVESYG